MKFTTSLKKNYQFRLVYNKGRSLANTLLVLYVMENGAGINRLGLSVSKKVGNSVVRHRVSRLIRESYRLRENEAAPGYDMIVIARPPSAAKPFADIDAALWDLLNRFAPARKI